MATEKVDVNLMDTTEASNISSDAPDTKKDVKEPPKYLDLAFAMDCTGSMGSYIKTATENIHRIVEGIVSQEKSDVRLALVEYRDHPPQDSSFVTRVHDFTQSVRSMKQWLDACSASGGGDHPEAVADALQQVLKLSWRAEATKVCVFIADAPPHGLSHSGDGFPNGCPDGIDPMMVTQALAQNRISLYMVGCEPSITPYRDFFMGLAHLTGGQYVPLSAAHLLTQVITGGVLEELSLHQAMEEVNQEVQQEFQSHLADIDEADLTNKVYEKLKARGVRAKKLQRNAADLPEASVVAQQMSSCADMSSVKTMQANIRPERRGRGMCASGAPPPPPPPSSSSGGVGGFLNNIFSFGKSKKSSMPAPPLPLEDEDEFDRRDDICTAAPCSLLDAPEDMYNCIDDEISSAQVNRMVQKAVYSNRLETRYNKKH